MDGLLQKLVRRQAALTGSQPAPEPPARQPAVDLLNNLDSFFGQAMAGIALAESDANETELVIEDDPPVGDAAAAAQDLKGAVLCSCASDHASCCKFAETGGTSCRSTRQW